MNPRPSLLRSDGLSAILALGSFVLCVLAPSTSTLSAQEWQRSDLPPSVAGADDADTETDRAAERPATFEYQYLDQTITLRFDTTRAFARFRTDDAADHSAALIRDLSQQLAIATPTVEHVDAPRTAILHFATHVSPAEKLAFCDALHADESVEWSAIALRYGNTLLAALPRLFVFVHPEQRAAVQGELFVRGVTIEREFDALPNTWIVVSEQAPSRVFEIARDVSSITGVETSHPVFFSHIQTHSGPDDPLYATQWPHQNSGQFVAGFLEADIRTAESWMITTGSPQVRIAVLDDGIDGSHPDLAANIEPGYDATDLAPPISGAGWPRPEDSHGTACAGVAGAIGNNGVGLAGVSWSSRLIPIRMGYGTLFTQTDWVVDAITWAVDNDADILSCSWGGLAPTQALLDAVDYAESGRAGLGTIVVFSAGNGNEVEYPAAYPSTIAVGASSPCDERKSQSSCDGETWWWSATGPELDVVAPGVLIPSLDNVGAAGSVAGSYVTNFNGTSAACPHVAGALALLLAMDPTLTSDEARSRLQLTAADEVGIASEDTVGFDEYMGHGRLDVWELLGTTIDVFPVYNLDCVSLGASMQLAWEFDDPYTAIIIERNGIVLAVLPGNSTEYLDTAPPAGNVTYRVHGLTPAGVSPRVACSLFFLGDLTDLVWNPVATGSVDGGAEIALALGEAGRLPLLITELADAPPLESFETVWVNLGVFPHRHTLSDSEVSTLVDYLQNVPDASLYLEGGDVWYVDGPAELLDLMGIAALADGSGSLTTIEGSDATSCDLASFAVINYEGENTSIDHLTPLGGATAVLSNLAPPFVTAIFNESATYRTLGASHEFGGLQPDGFSRRELISAYLLCFLSDSNVVRAGSAEAGPDESATQFVYASSLVALGGYQLGMTYDPTILQTVGVTLTGTDTEAAEFWETNVDNLNGFWTLGVVADFTPPLELQLPLGYDFSIARATYEVSRTATVGEMSVLAIPDTIGTPPIPALLFSADGTTIVPDRIPATFLVVPPQMTMRAESVVVAPRSQFIHHVLGTYHENLTGYSIAASFDSEILEVLELDLDGTAGFGAPFFSPVHDNDGGWLTVRVLSDVELPVTEILPAAADEPLIKITFRVDSDAMAGSTSLIQVNAVAGVPLVATSYLDWSGVTHLPNRMSGVITIEGERFVRGDANVSGGLPNIADSIATLEYLFGPELLACLDAADVNDDGAVDIGDVIFSLNYQFTAGAEPPAPFPAPGEDPTPDSLDCAQSI